MTEQWKSLKGTVVNGDLYEVSNLGRVRNINTNAILSGAKNHKGYLRVCLTLDGAKKQYFIHKLVALAFIPNPENKPQVNHIKGLEKDNNRVDNLEWATRSENMQHAYETGLEVAKQGEDTNMAKLANKDVIAIKKLLVANVQQKEIAKRFDVSPVTISAIKTGYAWSHLEVEGFTPSKEYHSTISSSTREKIYSLYSAGNITQTQLGKQFGIPTRTISSIIARERVK
ncbi:HNH homing endonuclease [Bacillus phage Mater]|uniref:HNH homing endonuclease n=1 Tax=Bacillus phage Mater TaxID=1540090 RepID=A0A0A0RMM3_9CAUD|nr:HNH endonuclease [Bacillus phage Mater]AIW03217.1 HNH homing endonuclease [Bacillus phage Mater]